MFIVLDAAVDIGSSNRLPCGCTVLVISRDIVIVATVAIVNLAIGPRTFRPSMLRKVATATYIVTGVVCSTSTFLGEPSLTGR